ncbi:hypothetical protein MUB48_11360 [Blautia sp. NSJ-157]|uniref:hypothetical protein n=1 Tax=Blautia sp. NSJ-157 TaxID=2931393 RepID=UPI001FD3722B|nr:hypothetical protein [Blautia sp. NSJ-157]MCJ7862000.1 hypothetical protein [Blautia sp. NSJ-157]
MEIIDMSTKRKLKKMVSVLFILGCFFIGNTKCKGADLEYISQETANYAVQERGYDLPVDEVVKEEAIEDCKNVMNQMKAIYQKADKGTSSNVVVSETVMEEMQEVLKEKMSLLLHQRRIQIWLIILKWKNFFSGQNRI